MIKIELYEVYLDKEFYKIYHNNLLINLDTCKIVIARTTQQIRIISRDSGLGFRLVDEIWRFLIQHKDMLDINNYGVGELAEESLYYIRTFNRSYI
jgi:hypothetical protein